MKVKLYQKYEWKAPFCMGVFLGLACLGGAIANLISKGTLFDIIVFIICSLTLLSAAYFGGWRRKKVIDENIFTCEKYEEIKEEEKKDDNLCDSTQANK